MINKFNISSEKREREMNMGEAGWRFWEAWKRKKRLSKVLEKQQRKLKKNNQRRKVTLLFNNIL